VSVLAVTICMAYYPLTTIRLCLVSNVYIAVTNLVRAVQSLPLAFSKGLNRVIVFLPEDGNISSFLNTLRFIVFRIPDDGQNKKKKQAILNTRHHRQNPLECTIINIMFS
jgi:hypothetical protein